MSARTPITPALLRAVGASSAAASTYAPLLDVALTVPGDARNSITSLNGVAMLVSQLAHESGGFSTLSENLNYRAEALVRTFGEHRISQAAALRLGKTASHPSDPLGIANTVYGGPWGRENLGNTEPGDGWRFRGGGLIQLTGRANYEDWAGKMDLTPEQAAEYIRTPPGAVSAALWFWREKGLIGPAYLGDVSLCTRIINGGQNGLADRLARFKAARAAA